VKILYSISKIQNIRGFEYNDSNLFLAEAGSRTSDFGLPTSNFEFSTGSVETFEVIINYITFATEKN
jgi:hypothetical protein